VFESPRGRQSLQSFMNHLQAGHAARLALGYRRGTSCVAEAGRGLSADLAG
jgi:hypothetical protein